MRLYKITIISLNNKLKLDSKTDKTLLTHTTDRTFQISTIQINTSQRKHLSWWTSNSQGRILLRNRSRTSWPKSIITGTQTLTSTCLVSTVGAAQVTGTRDLTRYSPTAPTTASDSKTSLEATRAWMWTWLSIQTSSTDSTTFDKSLQLIYIFYPQISIIFLNTIRFN